MLRPSGSILPLRHQRVNGASMESWPRRVAYTGSRMQPSGSRGTTDARNDAEVITLIAIAHGTSHFFQLMLPPLFPWLMRDFSLSYTQVGLLTTTFFVISGIGQALAGFAVDRIGAVRVLLFGVAALVAAALLLSVSSSYTMLLATAALAGTGNSIFHPADFTILNHRVGQARLGHAFSMHGLGGNLGWAAAPVVMAGLTSILGWHAAAVAATVVGSTVFAALWLRRRTLQDQPESIATDHASAGAPAIAAGYFAFLSSGPVWLSFAFFLVTTMAFGILQNYAPAILSHVYGVSLVLANSGLTAYLLGSGAGMIVGGFLAERGDRLVAAALGFAALMSAVLASGAMPTLALWPLMTAMGFGVGMAGPGRDLLVRRAATSRFGRGSFGRVYGFVYSGLDTGQALSPVLFGPLLDAGHFRQALVAVALLQASGLVFALNVGRQVRSLSPLTPAVTRT
jgi:MFS transporter, FSR family, fosmidomycin resistance protein